jgi:hypothetical protein
MPQTNHASGVHTVAAALYLQFELHVILFRMLNISCTFVLVVCGLGSSVGIATGYGLDGPGIESRWG